MDGTDERCDTAAFPHTTLALHVSAGRGVVVADTGYDIPSGGV